MPIYVYQVISEDGAEGETFEFEQSMKEDALTKHPATGQPVQRVYLPPISPPNTLPEGQKVWSTLKMWKKRALPNMKGISWPGGIIRWLGGKVPVLSNQSDPPPLLPDSRCERPYFLYHSPSPDCSQIPFMECSEINRARCAPIFFEVE